VRERVVAVEQLRLFDDLGDGDDLSEPADDEVIRPLADVDFAGVDAAFLCVRPDQAPEWAARATAAGALVIDLTQALAEAGEARLIVPEVNADAIEEALESGIFGSPVPTAVGLSVLLKAIDDPAELKRVAQLTLDLLAQLGRPAVEESRANRPC
jgi:aspartate-semialdehyde dehydrogenase